MKRYTQKQARADIRTGFAMDGNILYQIHGTNIHKALGNYEKISIGTGVYGINCGLVKSSMYGYVAFPSRSSALFCIF